MFRSTREIADRWPVVEEQPTDETDIYNCDICSDGEWCSETEVDLHKQTVHKKELRQLVQGDTDTLCKMCIQEFPSPEDLIKHIKSEHLLSSEDAVRVEREIFICDYCQTIFFNKKHLIVHILYIHFKMKSLNKRVECPRCFKIVKVHGIWFHFQFHQIQSVATCRICLHKCKHRKHLREHLKIHKKHLFCDMCQYQTKKEDLFKQHLAVRHKPKDAMTWQMKDSYFMPSFEDYKLVKVSGLRGLTLMNYVRVCVLCRQICVNEEEMKSHLADHMVVEKPQTVNHECVCGEKFLNKVLLTHHVFKMKGGHRAK